MQKDSHRTNIITLIECEGNARIFDRWPMPYREISDMELKMVNHILFWIKIVNKSLEINNELILKNLSNLEEKLAA